MAGGEKPYLRLVVMWPQPEIYGVNVVLLAVRRVG
jgi:hypothetical protein